MFQNYLDRLGGVLAATDCGAIEELAQSVRDVWQAGGQIFICGNGGSGGNAIHLANDYLYGCAGDTDVPGIRVHALTANSAVLTCLANDEGYETIFAIQLETYAKAGDLLLAFSGSGNSPNILKVLEKGRELGVKTAAILGYDGGQAKALADLPIHFDVHDMQISEDMQLVVGHMIMQWLYANPVRNS